MLPTLFGRTLPCVLILYAGLSKIGNAASGSSHTKSAFVPASVPPLVSPVAPVRSTEPATSQVRHLRVTAYHDRGLTAAGVPSDVGQCAAPADVPFGSTVYIPALNRKFVVTDRTHKRFRHNTIDIFMPDRNECLEFGRHYLDCVITPPDKPVRYGSPSLLQLAATFASQP